MNQQLHLFNEVNINHDIIPAILSESDSIAAAVRFCFSAKLMPSGARNDRKSKFT
jgi:hypothetical protein